jgi:hypothetical protein
MSASGPRSIVVVLSLEGFDALPRALTPPCMRMPRLTLAAFRETVKGIKHTMHQLP